MKTFIVIVLAALLLIIPVTCTQAQTQSDSIGLLTRDIQGEPPGKVRDLIISRFGPPARDVGSGVQIEQWDVAGGVLTFHPIYGPTFAKAGVSTRLIQTTNLIKDCLFGEYEMTTLPDTANRGTQTWLGNITISMDGHYGYKGGGQAVDNLKDQDENFFMLHPGGTIRVAYAEGVTPQTRLEDVPDRERVATVTFTAKGALATKAYDVVAYRSRTQLAFEGKEPMPFQMEKGWVSYWQ